MPGRSPTFPLAEDDPMLAARWPSDYDDSDVGGDSQETIYLLQQEVERLEAELRLRDESAPAAAPAASVEEELAAREALMKQVRDLVAEVAVRDQTIGLLHEQVHYLEQVASGARA